MDNLQTLHLSHKTLGITINHDIALQHTALQTFGPRTHPVRENMHFLLLATIAATLAQAMPREPWVIEFLKYQDASKSSRAHEIDRSVQPGSTASKPLLVRSSDDLDPYDSQVPSNNTDVHLDTIKPNIGEAFSHIEVLEPRGTPNRSDCKKCRAGICMPIGWKCCAPNLLVGMGNSFHSCPPDEFCNQKFIWPSFNKKMCCRESKKDGHLICPDDMRWPEVSAEYALREEAKTRKDYWDNHNVAGEPLPEKEYWDKNGYEGHPNYSFQGEDDD